MLLKTPLSGNGQHILNVFLPGLIQGADTIIFNGRRKRYAYVEHPVEGWRVFLRTAVFIHEEGVKFDARRFIVVKKTGTRPSSRSWEPPKGQAEEKDADDWRKKHGDSVLGTLTLNAIRETEEESFIKNIKKLRHTGMVFQSQESNYPSNVFFQYHILQGFVDSDQIKGAIDMFSWIHAHPKAFARFRADRREKDRIGWYNPITTPLNNRWTPAIAVLYFKYTM